MRLTASTPAVLLPLVVVFLILEPSLANTRLAVPSAQRTQPTTRRKNPLSRRNDRKTAVARDVFQAPSFLAKRIGTKQATIPRAIDYASILRYIGALAVQTTASYGMWMGVDWALGRSPISAVTNHGVFRFFLVYFLNLKTNVFNPLPTVSERTDRDLSPNRRRPSWTPPPLVFALMWPLFVFGTRAYALVAVADRVGSFANPVTLAMMFHFAIGGVWSYVNRIQEQLGTSTVLLWGLFLTKAFTAYLAYGVLPRAGIALACTLSWIGAAACLQTDTWRLNPDPRTGTKQPLLPRK